MGRGLVGARLWRLLRQLRHVFVDGTRGTDVRAPFARRRPRLRPRRGTGGVWVAFEADGGIGKKGGEGGAEAELVWSAKESSAATAVQQRFICENIHPITTHGSLCTTV